MVEANIVRDFNIGNARIKIADNYCRTAGEVDGMLKDIAAKAQRQFTAAASIKRYGREKNAECSAYGN